MKIKKKTGIVLLIISLIIVFVIISCKGEAGEAGATGPTGSSGEDANYVVVKFKSGMYPYSGYTGTEDAYLSSDAPDTNSSSGANLYSILVGPANTDMRRGVLKFDLEDIEPDNVIVKDAELRLYVNGKNLQAGGITLTAYALIETWQEDSVTWNSRETGITWTTSGGTFSISKQLFTPIYISDNEVTVGDEITIQLDKQIVQEWINNPEENNGMLIMATEETYTGVNWIKFDSSERDIIENRPELIIKYELP